MPDVLNGPEKPATLERLAASVEQPVVPEASSVEADEQTLESLDETKDDLLHAEDLAAPELPPTPTSGRAQAPASSQKDEVVVEVEKILEDGLGPFYGSLPEEAKPLFKQRGEEAAREISTMVRTFHVQVKRVLELIIRWLKVIPGVNKFFLEQEAKIKTDRIMALAEERKKDSG